MFQVIPSSKMSQAIGQAYVQTLQGLSKKEELLRIHRGKHDLSRQDAETIFGDYLEFIALKAHFGDTMGKKFSASPEIKALWRTHILNT